MNIRDIAQLADVTPGTVSKVLNNYPEISEATRKHVLRIIEENQYDPKANSHTSGSDLGCVGIVVEGVYNEIYAYLEDGLSKDLHNSSYSISSFHDNYYVQDKTEKLTELAGIARRKRWCGLLYIGGSFRKVGAEIFEMLPCPTIFIDTALPDFPGNPCYSSIQVSNYPTAFDQMRYLIEKGHRHICTVISSFVDDSVYGLRCEGYQEALRQYNLEDNIQYFLRSDYQMDRAYAAVKEHLRLHPETTAICCEIDYVVTGVLRAVADAGKIAGKEVDIISFDGMLNTQYCVPSITTFVQPVKEMEQQACKLLYALISGEQGHQHITFSPILRKGESS